MTRSIEREPTYRGLESKNYPNRDYWYRFDFSPGTYDPGVLG